MKKITYSALALLLSATILSGCVTSTNLAKIKLVSADIPAAEVTIYREPVLMNARALKAIVGVNSQEIVELKNAEYTKFLLPQGEHKLYVRSDRFDQPNYINLSLKKNTCLKVSANASNLAKAFLFSPAFLVTSTFSIQEDVCLDEVNVTKYKAVPFVYDDRK